MITVKRFFYAAAMILAALLFAAAGTYLLVSDATMMAFLSQRIESATGLRIDYQEPAKVTRTLSPTLELSDLSVAHQDAGYRLHTSSLQLQISLPHLFLGRLDVPRLWLGDTRVNLTTSAAPGVQLGPEHPSLTLTPVLHDVQVAQLSVVREGEETELPPLHVEELTLELQPDADALSLSARIEFAGKPVAIDATLLQFHKNINTQKFPFSISAQGPILNLSTKGQVDFSQSPVALEAKLQGQARRLEDVPTGVQGLVIPGNLAVQGQLSGTFDQLALENLAVRWTGPGQSTAELSGRIADLMELGGVDLGLVAKANEAPWVAVLLADSTRELNSADLTAQVSGAYPRLAVRDVRLEAGSPQGLDFSFVGQFDLAPGSAGLAPQDIDLKLAFAAPTTRAARTLLFEQVPEFGPINGKVDIASSTGAPRLENIVVSTRDPQGVEADLTGGIASFPLDPDISNTGYDLAVVMKATRASLMAERLGIDLPLSGAFDTSFRIEGDTQALRLEQIALSAGEKSAVSLDATGQVFFGDWDQDDPLKTINLSLKADSRDTASLAKLIGQDLPEFGALGAQARLQTVSGRHQVKDFRVQTATGSAVAVSLTGAADHLAFLPDFQLEGIQLKAEASTGDSGRLNAVFGLQDAVPAIGPLQLSARISGNDQSLAVSNLFATAGQKDILQVDARGRLGDLTAANNWHPQNTDLSITAESSSSSALARAMDFELPDLGAITANAKIQDEDKTLRLHDARILVGDPARPVVSASGFIDDLYKTANTRWDLKLNLQGQDFAAFADEQELPDLGPLMGEMIISGTKGSLGIDTFHLESEHSELLSLRVDGQFDDFAKPDTLVLNGRLNARDSQLVGALFDQTWPARAPFEIDTRVGKSGETTQLTANMKLGELRAQADLNGVFDAKPPRISGKVVATNVYFPNLHDWIGGGIEKTRAEKTEVFSREPLRFRWLELAHLDIAIDVQSTASEELQIQSAQFGIALQSAQLSISPARFVYPKGALELDIKVDARDTPQMSFTVRGENVDPWQALAMERTGTQFDAQLDMDVALTSSGESPHELAANAEGEIYVTLKDGKLPATLIDLIFADIVGWSWRKTRGRTHYDFSCGVADYSIEQGVVSTNAFMLDSDRIAITGEGSADLGKETIDYVFLPRKKARLVRKADPVKLTGDLGDPKVEAIPWKSAATTYGGLVFAPYIFAGVLAADIVTGTVRSKVGDKESPCLQYKRKSKGSE